MIRLSVSPKAYSQVVKFVTFPLLRATSIKSVLGL